MSWVLIIDAAPLAGVNNQIPLRLVTEKDEHVGALLYANTPDEKVTVKGDTTTYEYFSDLKYAVANGVNLRSLHYKDMGGNSHLLPDDWHRLSVIASKVF